MPLIPEQTIKQYRDVLNCFDFLCVNIKVIPINAFNLKTIKGINNMNRLEEALAQLKIQREIHSYKIDITSTGQYLSVRYHSPSISGGT